MHYVFYWKVLRQSYLLTHDDSQMAWGKLDMMRIIMAWHTSLVHWGVCVGWGVQIRLSFFSLLYGTQANISRKPATGGMASQHLRTLERMYS